MRVTRHLAVLACLVLGACGTATVTEVPERNEATQALPPMKTFSAPRVTAPARSNAAIARDFLDLTFEMESGRTVPVMTRFSGTVTVRVTGNPPASLAPDLNALLTRLRSEAGISIRQVGPDEEANITIEALPRSTLQRLVPQAACFVVPRVTTWADYKRQRRSQIVDWATLTTRTRAAIFLPNDVSPQEVRDCLHEELAQALGPLNDLYRLPDSVFNDDNFHTVLTGFDMLILRVYYAPELQNGMSRSQVAARLPAVLARLNPRGQRPSGPLLAKTPRPWIDAIETALGPGAGRARRRNAANAAVAIAAQQGWRDSRLAFSLFVQGRMVLPDDPDRALSAFLQASDIYDNLPGTELQAAHVSLHLSAFALSSGQPDVALTLINTYLPPVAQAQNAALMATMMMIKAEALDALNRPAEARAVRLDSLGWARYGFGSDREVRIRLREIAALGTRRQT